MKHKLLRRLCYLISLICIFFVIAPLAVYGLYVFGPGMVFLLILSAVFGSLPIVTDVLRNKGGKWLKMLYVWYSLIGAGVLVIAVLTALVIKAAYFTPIDEQDPPETVMVLGCQVLGDQPSLMLARRLNVALEYLNQYPQARCVVTGGQGDDEAHPEAYVMKKYLVENGISSDRIFEEDQSRNTKQNFNFSMKIIKREGLDQTIAVATDSLHEYRASLFAKDHGLSFHALPTNTPPLLSLSFYLREYAAILKSLLFDRT